MYVDLALLYQDNATTTIATRETNPEVAFTLIGDKLVVKQAAKPPKKIDSLDKWQSAFHTYMSVFPMKHTSRWAELLKYAETIRTAALQFPGWG